MTSRFFAVRSTDIAHDSIDGESVVIDMAQGIYYRLDGAAAVAWQALLDGAGTAGITSALVCLFDVDAATAGAAVGRFVDDLEANSLIELREAAAEDVTPTPQDAARGPFLGLVIHRFSDLQELFAIDPVHQVDQTGWPHRALTDG